MIPLLYLLIGATVSETISRRIASTFLDRVKRSNTWHHAEELTEAVVELWMQYNIINIILTIG